MRILILGDMEGVCGVSRWGQVLNEKPLYEEARKLYTLELGWRLREDPFSGHDLRYSRRKSSFTLYSIGPDLRDGGGARFKNDYPRPGRGDITWPYSHE